MTGSREASAPVLVPGSCRCPRQRAPRSAGSRRRRTGPGRRAGWRRRPAAPPGRRPRGPGPAGRSPRAAAASRSGPPAPAAEARPGRGPAAYDEHGGGLRAVGVADGEGRDGPESRAPVEPAAGDVEGRLGHPLAGELDRPADGVGGVGASGPITCCSGRARASARSAASASRRVCQASSCQRPRPTAAPTATRASRCSSRSRGASTTRTAASPAPFTQVSLQAPVGRGGGPAAPARARAA